MPSPFATDMETNSQYSSCETLDSHRSSESDEKREVNGNQQKTRKISAEHTDYIVKERVTRKEPPKPAYNPMQFVAIKPSNLYHTAQEQLKKAEEIKKVKDKELTNRKEDPEDWQNNLDNWKSSRRKRVEHIIDRIVEVKKLEEGEHDRNRRSIKTFSELMEERSGSRQHRKLSTLAIYTEEDDSTFDMNDLLSDENGSSDKMETNSDNNSDKEKQASDTTTDDVFNNNNGSSNNNDASNFHSTALIKDVIHKKQETTIPKQQQQQQQHDDDEEEVKTEVEQRITTDLSGDMYKMSMSAKVTTQTSMSATKTTLRSLESRERDYTYDDAIEDYKTRVSQAAKFDLPKVDITKRRELFEQVQAQQQDESANISTTAAKLGTEIVSIKDRISSLRSNLVTNGSATNTTTPPKKVDLSVSTTLKDRLSSLHQQVSPPVDETSKRILDTPFKNVVETRNEFEKQQQQQMSVSHHSEVSPLVIAPPTIVSDNESLESDRDDSGIEHQQSMNYPKSVPDVIQHESIITLDDSKEDDMDEESSVSYSENDQIQSVMVLGLSDSKTTNTNSSTLAAISASSPKKTSNMAMFNFIHSNYRSFDDESENIEDNEFLLECMTSHDGQMKRNELEKSNSVDTALSLCSSSDGTSLMDDYLS